MGTCELYLLVMGMIVLGDSVVFLLAPKLIKARTPEAIPGGGEVSRGLQPVTIMRAAIAMSILFVIGIFLYLLSQEGCLG